MNRSGRFKNNMNALLIPIDISFQDMLFDIDYVQILLKAANTKKIL